MASVPTFKRPDGSISRLCRNPGMSDADMDAEAARLLTLPEYAGHTYVGWQDAPSSRRFRDCWRHNAGVVDVHLPTARQQRIAELRADRDALLAAADVLFAKAQDAGTAAQVQACKTYRQALRDMPTTIATDLAALTGPAALEAYSPTWPTAPVVP
jgi:hypothetical protein